MTSVYFYSIECFRGPMIDEVGVTESLALQRSLVVTSPTILAPDQAVGISHDDGCALPVM
jgi:hypothetical protein